MEEGAPPHEVLSFTRAERPDLFQIAIALRIEVFVHEQKFALEVEQDATDDTCRHWILVSKGTH
jgi:predicted GNAT family N-acyltransferase